MIKRYGMASAIVDTFDTELHKFGRGQRPDIEALVNKVVDGEEINMASLNDEQVKYVKTARVLMGQSLYSDSWLEI
jgi:5-methyltetrahydrofolate corrinoid/iron sulfur protein methyltransferase